MNTVLGLNLLGKIMDWDDASAQSEYLWLVHMARFKYDSYRDYLAGARFVESLANWLQQFPSLERKTAYEFVKSKLVYFGHLEMQRLVEAFYPREIYPLLLRQCAAKLGVPYYRVPAAVNGSTLIARRRREILFMALSDGARLDGLRHANAGRLSNEQFVIATQIDEEKWVDLLGDLKKDLGDPDAKFSTIYLVDDFMGTGTSFLRYDQAKSEWKGKLQRFHSSVDWQSFTSEDCELRIHHYIATAEAAETIPKKEAELKEMLNQDWHLPKSSHSFGLILPRSLSLLSDETGNDGIIHLARTFYNPAIETKHTKVGGTDNICLGYGDCALPLVLEHNTPNNSIPLLWAETVDEQLSQEDQDKGDVRKHPMTPLFRRRQRHS